MQQNNIKIALPTDSKTILGGGNSFRRNFIKGLSFIKEASFVEDYLQADIALITSATMVSKETFRAIKEKGIKIVTRIDNAVRDSRNRGSGMSRLRNFSLKADRVIWQSEWARDYLQDFIGREDGVVIYNGVDLDIFRPGEKVLDFGGRPTYLFSRYSRDENKRYEEIWYKYQLIQKNNKNAKLILIGKFSPEIIEYNFDFFNAENYEYLGVIDNSQKMAYVYRSCDFMFAPYFNDCFSNTYLEFLATKNENKLFDINYSGGTPEMIELFNSKGREYFSLERMVKDYLRLFEEVLEKK